MKTRDPLMSLPVDAINNTRRNLLKALPAIAIVPFGFGQVGPSPIAVQKLHSFQIRVSDVADSLKFYQVLFGAPIQSRQGVVVCLRIGEGPQFFSIAPVLGGELPGISHIGLSVADFDVNSVAAQLREFGLSRSITPPSGQNDLNEAMRYWVDERRQTAGGSISGSRDLYFADVEGIRYQLSSENHCGGGGDLGETCANLELAPGNGLFPLVDISHFTTFLANRDRANDFYTSAFGKEYQAYQGPGSPVIGVGDGVQFLMYVGGDQQGQPTQAGRIDHACFSMDNFDVDAVLANLTDYGLTARENASDTQPFMHWISMRMPNRGGAEGGTPELYFSDPDGIRIQLQDPTYCGGGGYLGDSCLPPA